MQELLLLKQMIGADNWLSAVFLAGMFAILAFRRESIEIPGLFKLSILIFAASLVMPALLAPLVSAFGGGNYGGGAPFGGGYTRSNGDLGFVVSLVYGIAGPGLFALSLMCGVWSVFPRKLPKPRAAAVPTK